jgi:ribose-phosphate pyrophosphokinase
MLAHHYKNRGWEDIVIVATDAGDAKRARSTADILDAPIAIVEKQRIGNQEIAEAANFIGDVEGKTAVIVDDEITSGGTVVATVRALQEHGAKDIYCAATHGVFSGNALERIYNSGVKEIVITDTLPISDYLRSNGTTVLSVAPILGEAIHRIHSGLSVGAMFEQERSVIS